MISADTSFLIALANRNDKHHEEARALEKRIAADEFGEMVMAEYVAAEVCSVLLGRCGHSEAVRFMESLLAAPSIHLVASSPAFRHLMREFAAQSAGKLSLVDCAVVHAARQAGTPFVASFDTDFDGVAGIKRVP